MEVNRSRFSGAMWLWITSLTWITSVTAGKLLVYKLDFPSIWKRPLSLECYYSKKKKKKSFSPDPSAAATEFNTWKQRGSTARSALRCIARSLGFIGVKAVRVLSELSSVCDNAQPHSLLISHSWLCLRHGKGEGKRDRGQSQLPQELLTEVKTVQLVCLLLFPLSPHWESVGEIENGGVWESISHKENYQVRCLMTGIIIFVFGCIVEEDL